MKTKTYNLQSAWNYHRDKTAHTRHTVSPKVYGNEQQLENGSNRFLDLENLF